MSGHSYTAPDRNADTCLPMFHHASVLDEWATKQAGRPKFRTVERVQIIMPGNPNKPVYDVGEQHKQRWPKQYEQFKAGSDWVAEGTPLEMLQTVNMSRRLELKAIGIHTVEQLSALNDQAIQKIGMEGRRLVELAKVYLDDSERLASTNAAIARADHADATIENLRAEMARMRTLMDEMQQELLSRRVAPAVQDVDHVYQTQPMQSYHMEQGDEPPLPMAPRRGRPPGSKNIDRSAEAA